MLKVKVIGLFDKIFISICMFLICYAWINFFIRNLWITFLLSLIFSFSFLFIVFYFSDKRSTEKNLTKEYIKNIEKNFLIFQLLSFDDKLNLLKNIIEKKSECRKKKNSLFFNDGSKNCQLTNFFESEKLNQFNLLKIISSREKNVEVLKIICSDFEPNINTQILKNLEVEIITKKKLYDEYFLSNNISLDDSNLNTGANKKSIKEILKNLFVPHKAKQYFFCGLVLIFSSIILPYHIYYLIVGSTLLIFSVLCKISKYHNP